GVQVATIELDETTVEPPSAPRASFHRVEVELVDGSVPTDIDRFVTAMADACDLRATSTSKYAMGLQAASLDPRGSLDFGSTTTDPDAGILSFAYGWLRTQWAEFVRHEPGTRLGEDIEALHQMRVATRRLRAALRVFELVLPAPLLRLRDELQWVGHELGAVRDFDVQIEELEARRSAATWAESAALTPLILAIEQARAAVRIQLGQLLDSTRYDALVDEMSHLLRAGAHRGELAETTASVWTFAPPILSQRFRRAQRVTHRLSEVSPASDYHQLRILTKRLRYSLEIFTKLYGPPATNLTGTTKAIQDHLGGHQDAEVAIDRLRGLVVREGRDLPPETLVSVGRMIEQHSQHMLELRASAPPLLAELPRRWKAFRRVLREHEDHAPSDARIQPMHDAAAATVGNEHSSDAPSIEVPGAYQSARWVPPTISTDNASQGANALTRMRQLFQHD
ncbi:MAG: CHAD domain-containing protein, partial [Dehalococcoidia bacterium]